MKRVACFLLLALAATGLQASRIKDITTVEGGRDNQLVGYGLVVGLAGDGDSRLSFTVQSVANALERFGINVHPDTLKSDNVAAVMVTADIMAFARPGSRIDVTVSSIGDADSLQGGVLLQTPLMGADGQVYAVAQGPVAVGGFIGGQGGLGGATVQKNHPTVGMITGGAIVEREIETQVVADNSVNLLLLNPDYTTAVRLADEVNKYFPGTAQAKDLGLVNVRLPENFRNQETNFIAIIGNLEVIPDTTARIIINERTGTIVATQSVRLSSVAVSHGALVITISSSLGVSQPPPTFGGGGDAVVVPSTDTDVTEVTGRFAVIENYPTLERLTAALNALGVTTREMISILQTMKRAGALQAELIIN